MWRESFIRKKFILKLRIEILQAGLLYILFILPAYIFNMIFIKPKDNLISARTD